jgi:hypothetical protein
MNSSEHAMNTKLYIGLDAHKNSINVKHEARLAESAP